MIQLYKLFCRNNCMMVTDFLIIHKTCIGLDWFVGKHTGKFPVRTCSTCLKTFFNSRNYVFSDISGIGPWISKNLMVLIEPRMMFSVSFLRKNRISDWPLSEELSDHKVPVHKFSSAFWKLLLR